MKLTISRQVLCKSLERTMGVIDRRGNMPILGHVLISADEDKISVSATDLEIAYLGILPAQVDEPGAITVPAYQFSKVLKELPSEDVEISANDDYLTIQAKEFNYRFSGLPADQFPPIPEPPETSLQMRADFLKEMVRKTIFSISGDDLQYHLSSVFWEQIEDGGASYLRLVSTDGHRLSLIERLLPSNDGLDLGSGILVPRKGMVAINPFLTTKANVGLSLKDKTLVVDDANEYFFIRLLEKRFPEYRRIIPESFAYRFALDRSQIYDIIRRLSLLSTERFKGITLTLKRDSLEVAFQNPEVGEGRELMPLSLVQGNYKNLPIAIGFNARYLLEPLTVMSGETVYLDINSSDLPCRLMPADDQHYLSIIMPMSL